MNKRKVVVTILLFLIFLLIAFSLPAKSYAFLFVSWADTKSGTAALTAISAQAAAFSPAFTIYPGDVCDSGPNDSCFTTWQNALNGGNTPGNGMKNKTFATRGNHDDSSSYWVSHFDVQGVANNIRATNIKQLNTNLTYSFDFENSHFIGADMPGGDSSSISSAIVSWIDSDMAAAQANPNITHIFIFFHGPIYYVDDHTGSTAPDSLINVLNKYSKLSATFHGHEHLLAYTHMSSSRRSNITQQFEQFVTGAAGAGLYDCMSNRSDYCISSNGFAIINVSGINFTINIYTQGNTSPVKSYSFTKTGVITPTSVVTPTTSPNFPCLGANNTVDRDDAIAWASGYLLTNSTFDLDNDGKVNLVDFGYLVLHWGQACNH